MVINQKHLLVIIAGLLLSLSPSYSATPHPFFQEGFEEEMKVAQEETTNWTQEMINKHGPALTESIYHFRDQAKSYLQDEDENNAQEMYQELLKEYNPYSLNQAHRSLYNDFYKELADRKIWRAFYKDIKRLQSVPSAENVQALYQELMGKYQQRGLSGKSRAERLHILNATKNAVLTNLRLYLLSPEQSPEERNRFAPPPSPTLGRVPAPHNQPSPIFGQQQLPALESMEELELPEPGVQDL